MAAPTGAERTAYKGRIKRHEIRVDIETEYPVVATNFTLGSEDDWWIFEPGGTNVDFGGGAHISVIADEGVIRPGAAWTKEGIVFPVDKTQPWTLTWSMRFNYVDPASDVTKAFLATAFRVCGIDNTRTIGGSIVGVDGNAYLGTRLGIPDGNWIGTALPTTDTGFHTYTLSWDGTTYTASGPQGSATLAGAVAGVVTRGADFISIGMPGITSNIPAVWTDIEVASISMSGTTETVIYPPWTSNHASPFGDGKNFSYLPSHSVVGGSVNVDKDNEIDACEIILTCQDPLNVANRNIFAVKDQPYVNFPYSGFKFSNRRVVISSRQSGDGGASYTSWKQIFVGVIDEQEYSVDDNGGIFLTLRGRDINRRKMQRSLITKAYADFNIAMTGIPNSLTVGEILEDILTEAKVDPALHQVEVNALVPKTINILNQDCLSGFLDLADDLVYEVYVDHKNSMGKIFANIYTHTASGTADYDLSVYDEVILNNYTASMISQVGQVEVTVEGANDAPFFAAYPVNKWPGDAAGQQRPSRLVQEWEGLAGTDPFHVDAWRRENRDIGSIVVSANGQDWLEMNLNITVFDDLFLNITLGTIFQIDGWEYHWDEKEFLTKFRLIRRRPQDFLRSFI